jgi:hypothetical protein
MEFSLKLSREELVNIKERNIFYYKLFPLVSKDVSVNLRRQCLA